MNTIYLKTIDSTNTYAKKIVDQLPKDQIVSIVAEEQTGGRGRFDRKWVSSKGNLFVTFVFQLEEKSPALPILSHILCCSMAKVLQAQDLAPQIKWPNDLLLNSKKVAGVLCEMKTEEKIAIFLGIGLNVHLKKEEADEIDQPVTSLQIETGKTYDLYTLLKKLQTTFATDLKKCKEEGFAPLKFFYEGLLYGRGKKVRCTQKDRVKVGVLEGVDADGALLITTEGKTETIYSADLEILE